MGFLINLKEKFKFGYNKAKIDVYANADPHISRITLKEIRKFQQDARLVQESLQTPKLLDQPLHETIMQGAELAKQHNRKIATEEMRSL